LDADDPPVLPSHRAAEVSLHGRMDFPPVCVRLVTQLRGPDFEKIFADDELVAGRFTAVLIVFGA